ncbi:hypothetical protein ND972_13875 [Vibrio diabolicus]|uniref:hypothetical protein n=1 Tax=Vibrio diabolicus TaxID=50719 RepID=UPI00215E6BF5|nr:hypothetical protein [Vibrio diabolicus]MCS0397885.1 hypothetical protein [Vibrio diabolicus]
MTTDNENTQAVQQQNESNLPTHIAKVRHGNGKQATYERIGAAWRNEKGGIYVKLHGTQIVSEFTLFEVS